MKTGRIGLFLLCGFLLFLAGPINTQENPTLQNDENAVTEEKFPQQALTPEQQRIELEIKTSSLPELAAWCRSLGLSEGGTREELTRRLMDYFKIPLSTETINDKNKIITIESARTSEYFKIEVVDEEYARLSGDVRLSLIEGDAVHRISANDILFNRTRNILTARGGVEYIKEQGDTVETFRGENITVNLDNWSSIFLDGASERKIDSDGTTYRFSGAVITRSDEDVTILKKAEISNASNPEAYWSISATRLWLLPGSDFAIFNAFLKVGEIPVLYIPFFYYPADEVVFHPVIGFRSREGTFVQTTTYILGRPKASSSSQSSLIRITGDSNDTEKVQEGLFLRSTGKKVKDPDTTSLKALVDYYANLGAYFGLDLAIPKTGILNPLDVSLGIGITRTVSQLDNGNYSPFYPDFDGSSDWNSANLLSNIVPFRYRFKTQSSISGKYGSLSWSFPYYSDPFIDYDFMDRAEEMDWANLIQQGAATEDQLTAEQNRIQSYQWQLYGQLHPSFPKLAPYISGVSLTSFTSTLAFKTISDPGYSRDSPGREFFAPDKLTIYSISGSVTGTPLGLGAGFQPAANRQKPEIEDPLKNIGNPRSPWESNSAATETQPADPLSPPALNQRFDLPSYGSARFSIDYQLSPTGSSELQFRTGEWKTYEQINWSDVQSVLSSFGGNGSTNFNLNHSEGLFSNVFTLSGTGSWRQYSFQNEEAAVYHTNGIPDPRKMEAERRQQYSQSFYSTSYAYTGTLRPLYLNPIWGQSNLQYSFKSLIAKTNFIGDGDKPEWETIYGAWEKGKLDSHQFAANVIANIMDKTQNLNLTAELPPLDPAISANATLRVWISETNVRLRVTDPGDSGNRKIEPVYTTETLRFGNIGSLVHYMVFEPEPDHEFTAITTTLSLWGFQAAYTAARMAGYELMPQGWVQSNVAPSLQSKDFTLSYIKNFAQRELIKDRLDFSLNVNTRLFFDLQRYTYSSFNFTFGFTLGINNFLDLSLSATSANTVFFRYLKGIPGFEDVTYMYPDGEQNNLFVDLFDSFNFGNEERRRRSGFKLKSFNLNATHHLGDWNAVLGITMSPYLPHNSYKYDFSTDVSFLVQWIPISLIKTDIKYEKRTDKWTVK